MAARTATLMGWGISEPRRAGACTFNIICALQPPSNFPKEKVGNRFDALSSVNWFAGRAQSMRIINEPKSNQSPSFKFPVSVVDATVRGVPVIGTYEGLCPYARPQRGGRSCSQGRSLLRRHSLSVYLRDLSSLANQLRRGKIPDDGKLTAQSRNLTARGGKNVCS